MKELANILFHFGRGTRHFKRNPPQPILLHSESDISYDSGGSPAPQDKGSAGALFPSVQAKCIY